MGGAVGTDGIAVAVPSLKVVRQSNVLPYRVLIENLKHFCDDSW